MAINIAGQQILAQPVSGFLQGRALRRAEEESGARMKALEMSQAREQQQADREQSLFDEASKMRNTQVLHRALSQIESSDDPVATANTLAQSPEITEIFKRLGKDPTEGFRGKSAEEIRRAAAEGRAQLEPFLQQQGVEAQSPEGKVAMDVRNKILTPEQGDTALAGTSKEPSDVQIYKFAQAQGFKGSYIDFKNELRGEGFSMTMPDGTVISMGGKGGGVTAGELKTPVVTNLQESIVKATDQLDRLNSIGQSLDTQFLEVPGRIKGSALKIKDLAGGMLGDMTPQEKEYLTKFSTFKAEAAKNLSAILNQLSGAAISPAEGERLKKGIPNDEDSPTQFMAKYRSAVKDQSRAVMRANWALKNGIGVKSVDQLSKVMPLEAIDQVYERRANEIWQEMGGTPEAKQLAVQQANQEFGLAR